MNQDVIIEYCELCSQIANSNNSNDENIENLGKLLYKNHIEDIIESKVPEEFLEFAEKAFLTGFHIGYITNRD